MGMNRLGRGERIAGAAAVLLFIDMFLSWYSLNVADGPGYDAWRAYSTTDILLLLTILVALAMVVVGALGRGDHLPVSLPLVTACLGGLVTLIVLWRIVNQPGPDDVVNVEYGAYLGLLLVAVLTYGAVEAGGGVQSMRAEAESLQSRVATGDAPGGPTGATSVAEPHGPPPTAAAPMPQPAPPRAAPEPPLPGDDPAGPAA